MPNDKRVFRPRVYRDKAETPSPAPPATSGDWGRHIPHPTELATLRARAALRKRGEDVGPDSIAAILGLPCARRVNPGHADACPWVEGVCPACRVTRLPGERCAGRAGVTEPSHPAAPLPPDLAAEIARIDNCKHCGGRHERACPRVKRMTFHPNGQLASVHFWPDGKWSDDHVLWPEETEPPASP